MDPWNLKMIKITIKTSHQSISVVYLFVFLRFFEKGFILNRYIQIIILYIDSSMWLIFAVDWNSQCWSCYPLKLNTHENKVYQITPQKDSHATDVTQL